VKAPDPTAYLAMCEFTRAENSRLARENALLRELVRYAVGDRDRADELLHQLSQQLHAVPTTEVTAELHRRGVATPAHHHLDAPMGGAEGVAS